MSRYTEIDRKWAFW